MDAPRVDPTSVVSSTHARLGKLLEDHPTVVLTLLTACLLGLGLGSSDFFLWDEVFYGSRAVVAGYGGFWLDQSQAAVGGAWTGFHPPLVIWLMAFAGRVAGFGGWSLRVPIVLMGIASVVVLRSFVLRLTHSPRAALCAGVALALTPLFTCYARRCQLDVPVMFWITLSLFGFQRSLWDRSRWSLLSGVALGLALLSKLAVGLLAPLSVAVFLVWEALAGSREVARRGLRLLAVSSVLGVAIAAPWYVAMTMRYGGLYWERALGFHALARLTQVVEGHSTALGVFYYPLQAVVWMVTLAPFVVLGMKRGAIGSLAQDVRRFLWSWLLTPVILFSLSASRTSTYLLIFLPPLATFAGLGLATWLSRAPSRAELAAIWVAVVATVVWAQTTPVQRALETTVSAWRGLGPAPPHAIAWLGAFAAMLLILGLIARALAWRLNDTARAQFARGTLALLVFLPVLLMAAKPIVSGKANWIRLRREAIRSGCRWISFEGEDNPTNRFNLSLLETRGLRVTWAGVPARPTERPCYVIRLGPAVSGPN